MARSPYIEAKVNRWCKEKKELVIDDCDPVTFDIIVDYMYGSPIPDDQGRLMKLLQMSDMMQMNDLKGQVEEQIIKNLEVERSMMPVTMAQLLVLIEPAEKYNL